MKNYLVAIDGSDISMAALETAVGLAEKSHAKLTVITVFNIHAYGFGLSDTDSYNSVLDSNKNKLRVFLDKVEEEYQSPAYELETLIRVGDVSNEIIEEAMEGDYDLVFIGSRGLGAIKRAFLGSTSAKVLNSVEKPVIVVHEKTEFNKILVPVDGSRYSTNALILAAKIGKYFKSEITLLNVINTMHVPQMKTFDLELAMSYSDEARNISQEILKKAKETASYPFEMKTLSIEGDAAITISNVAKEDDFDLIVMGSKGLGAISRVFMGSVSREVVSSTKVTTLID